MTKQKRTQSTGADLAWGTPEHEAWRASTLGGTKVLHPVGCKCPQCKRLIKWAKGYQGYIAKVDR